MSANLPMPKPPHVIAPPFILETATLKVRLAEDGWNSRDPDRVALAYTEDSVWRNRSEFVVGRDQIRKFLAGKWDRGTRLSLGKSPLGIYRQPNRRAFMSLDIVPLWAVLVGSLTACAAFGRGWPSTGASTSRSRRTRERTHRWRHCGRRARIVGILIGVHIRIGRITF